MIPYWLLFAYFAVGALVERPGRGTVKPAGSLGLIFGALVVALMIGLRYRVGGDWGSYAFMYEYAAAAPLEQALRIGDPGYMFLNWAASSLGAEIWLVNLICGTVFTWGLMRLVNTQPAPWLAVLVAVPYLIIVVAMGYTRQAVAIGVLMGGLASLDRNGSTLRFALYVAVAALFHKTAVVALPLVTFASWRNKLLNFLIAAVSFWLLFNFFLRDSVDAFVQNYVKTKYSSQGAAIRVVMSFVPAAIYLMAQNRYGFSAQQKVIWRNMSVVAIALLILLIITPSSTVIDRLALYVIPLQVVILSRLPNALMSQGLGRLVVVAYSAAILFVWLNFAVHANAWVPYTIHPM